MVEAKNTPEQIYKDHLEDVEGDVPIRTWAKKKVENMQKHRRFICPLDYGILGNLNYIMEVNNDRDK